MSIAHKTTGTPFTAAEHNAIADDINANSTARHTHSNKALLDTYTQTESNLNDAVTKKHAHANSAALALVSGTNTGDQDLSALQTDSKSEVISIALSDLSTALTTGTNKAYFRMPWAGTLTAVKASVLTAPTGSTLVVDVNEAGTSVLSTKLSIDISEKTSATAATPAVISDSALASDAEITFDIDQIGSTIAGAGLIVYLYITRT